MNKSELVAQIKTLLSQRLSVWNGLDDSQRLSWWNGLDDEELMDLPKSILESIKESLE
jgi:hypothetical protein